MARRTLARSAVGSLAAASAVVGAIGMLSARAEPVTEGRATHLSLGAVSLAAGETRLPRDEVRIAWRTHVGTTLSGPALVRAGEPTVVADSRSGSLHFLGTKGEVLRTVPVSSQGIAGSPVRIADGTVVAVTGTGEVVGYRRDQLRFRVPVGPVHSSPRLLALDDGGFVLGLDTELVAFDAQGALRGRAALSDRLGGGLVPFDGAAGGAGSSAIAAVTSAGMVVLWTPGGEVRSVGDLGGSSAGMIGGQRTLTAVVDARLVDLDVVTHELRTRDDAHGTGLLLGAPLAVRSPVRSFAVAELDGSRLSALLYPDAPPLPGASRGPRRVHLVTFPASASADAAPPPAASAGARAGGGAEHAAGTASVSRSASRSVHRFRRRRLGRFRLRGRRRRLAARRRRRDR